MIDPTIRPPMFVGMRICFVRAGPFYNTWWTLTEDRGSCFLAVGDDGKDGSFSADYLYHEGAGLSYRLPGEEGCPVDSKNEEWKWEVGDEFYSLTFFFLKSPMWYKFIVSEIDGVYLGIEYFIDGKKHQRNGWPTPILEDVLHIPRAEKKQEIDLLTYPNKCPTCGEPAYVGLNVVDCSAGCGE